MGLSATLNGAFSSWGCYFVFFASFFLMEVYLRQNSLGFFLVFFLKSCVDPINLHRSLIFPSALMLLGIQVSFRV